MGSGKPYSSFVCALIWQFNLCRHDSSGVAAGREWDVSKAGRSGAAVRI